MLVQSSSSSDDNLIFDPEVCHLGVWTIGRLLLFRWGCFRWCHVALQQKSRQPCVVLCIDTPVTLTHCPHSNERGGCVFSCKPIASLNVALAWKCFKTACIFNGWQKTITLLLFLPAAVNDPINNLDHTHQVAAVHLPEMSSCGFVAWVAPSGNG